jgi:hypothetical protein
MKTPSFLQGLWIGLLLLVSAPLCAQPLTLGHQPPANAAPNQALVLTFSIEPASQLASALVRFRSLGATAWTDAPIRLSSTGSYEAAIPAAAMDDPGVEYLVLSTDVSGSVASQFASEQAPHPVLVRGDRARIRERETLAELGGMRSEFAVSAARVDYRIAGPSAGTAADTGPRFSDYQVRYRYWSLRGVEHIEVGVGRLDGWAESSDRSLVAPLPGVHTGFQRGWTQVGWRLQDNLGLAARLVLGADEIGFRLGFAGVLRIGPPKATHFELDIGSTAGVGWHVLSALHLTTLPRVPVTFEVLLTDGPNQSITAGEMTRLRLGWQATSNLTVTAVASYQARSGPDHGLGGGGEAMWRF